MKRRLRLTALLTCAALLPCMPLNVQAEESPQYRRDTAESEAITGRGPGIALWTAFPEVFGGEDRMLWYDAAYPPALGRDMLGKQKVWHRSWDGTDPVSFEPLDDRGVWGETAKYEWGHEALGADGMPEYQYVQQHVESNLILGYDDDTGEPIYGTPTELIWLTSPCARDLTIVPRGISAQRSPDYEQSRQEIYDAVKAIVDRFYPPDADGNSPVMLYDSEFDGSCLTLHDPGSTAGARDIAEGLMHALNDAGLIKAFYSWGERLNMIEIDTSFSSNMMFAFPEAPTAGYNPDPLMTANGGEPLPIDWAEVRVWLAAEYPGAELIELDPDDPEQYQQYGLPVPSKTDPVKYYIDTPDYGIRERFALCAALAERYGLYRDIISRVDMYYTPLFGDDMLRGVTPDTWVRTELAGKTCYYHTNDERWYDESMAPLTDSTGYLQTGRCLGEEFRVYATGKVFGKSQSETRLEELNAVMQEYIAFRPVTYSAVNGKTDEQSLHGAEVMLRTLPLTYRFDSASDAFACEILLGDTVLGRMEYTGETPGAVLRSNAAVTDLHTVTLSTGDATLSGEINIADAVLLARYLAEDSEVSLAPLGKTLCDLDRDSELTSSDLSALLRQLARVDF